MYDVISYLITTLGLLIDTVEFATVMAAILLGSAAALIMYVIRGRR